MKSRLLAIFLLIILIVFAFVYGAGKGWAKERAQVDAQLSSLQQHLDIRVETACNILTVAKRHMDSEDLQMLSLSDARDLLSGPADLAEKANADQQLTQAAEALLSALSQMPTVQNDDRDRMYVESMLPQMLRESESYTVASAYNTAAAEYNRRYDQNKLSSTIAGWLGIEHCEVFGSEHEGGRAK